MNPLLVAAVLIAPVSPVLAPPAPPKPLPGAEPPATLQLASMHVKGRGPGHLVRVQGAAASPPAACDGTLDLSTGCAIAVVVIF